jgi:hypothetical protein
MGSGCCLGATIIEFALEIRLVTYKCNRIKYCIKLDWTTRMRQHMTVTAGGSDDVASGRLALKAPAPSIGSGLS